MTTFSENKCVDCNAKCCKRYWITMMPCSVKQISVSLNLNETFFIKKNCVLFTEIFPLAEKANGIVLSSAMLPKKAFFAAEKSFARPPDFFLAMPFLAFKRINSKCIFLSEKNLCLIYPARPLQCLLFPDLSLSKEKESSLYSFCRIASSDFSHKPPKKTMIELKEYIDRVILKGFSSQWPALPGKGVFKIGSQTIKTSKKEFLQFLGPYQ